jgi:hypothetical protein
VNLANNQLTALPELWVTTWGKPNASTGLLELELELEQQDGGNKKNNSSAGVKVLVLGNPLLL